MLHVVIGGSGSGKSAWAEAEAVRLAREKGADLDRYYIATMESQSPEAAERIRRHRQLRAGKGFQTIECPVGLECLAEKIGRGLAEKPVALLECMSNLAANEIYRPDGAGEEAQERILLGVEKLCRACAHVVIVTNEVCSEGGRVSAKMGHYQRVLSRINICLARQAERVTEIVYGIPVEVKR